MVCVNMAYYATCTVYWILAILSFDILLFEIRRAFVTNIFYSQLFHFTISIISLIRV